MPTFGATVSAYNKKPSAVLNKYQTKPIAPIAPVQPATITPIAEAPKTQPEAVDNTKSAVSGGSEINASGLISAANTPIFQPNDTPDIGRKSGGGEYKRLNAIDDTTSILNRQMEDAVGSYNNASNAANQAPGYAGDMFGGGEGSGLDNEQLQYARQIASVGKSRGMDDNAIQIALMTALTESGLRNISHGDRDSVGLFQQRTSQGWGSIQQIMDPNYSANKFYDSLAKTNYKGMSPWQAAQSVQRSFDPTGSNYQKQYALAQRAFQSLTPNAAPVGGTNGAAGFIQSYNNKYLDFDGAYGAQCVDLFNFYNQRFVGAQRFPVQVASQLFNQYDRKAYTRLGANQGPGRMGDAAIFGPGQSIGPAGHVAIVVGDNGNGTLRVLHANATSAGSRGNSVISNISKSSLMGYLRPNRLM